MNKKQSGLSGSARRDPEMYALPGCSICDDRAREDRP